MFHSIRSFCDKMLSSNSRCYLKFPQISTKFVNIELCAHCILDFKERNGVDLLPFSTEWLPQAGVANRSYVKKYFIPFHLDIWPVYFNVFSLTSRDMAGIFQCFMTYISRYGRYISMFSDLYLEIWPVYFNILWQKISFYK